MSKPQNMDDDRGRPPARVVCSFVHSECNPEPLVPGSIFFFNFHTSFGAGYLDGRALNRVYSFGEPF